MKNNGRNIVIKANWQFMESQSENFTRPVGIVKELLNISLKSPIESLVFLVTFSVFGNSLHSLLQNLVNRITLGVISPNSDLLTTLLLLVLLIIIIGRLYMKSRSLYKKVPINEKKGIICFASYRAAGSSIPSPAESFIETILNGNDSKARKNNIQTIYVISTGTKSVLRSAKAIKKMYEIVDEREVKVIQIDVSPRRSNIEAIRKQLNIEIDNILLTYKPCDLLADITGGTKEMSVALYLSCLDKYILPIYLDAPKKSSTGQV